jgi:hypothetical protein
MEPGKSVVKRGMAQQRSLIQLLTGAEPIFYYRASFYSALSFSIFSYGRTWYMEALEVMLSCLITTKKSIVDSVLDFVVASVPIPVVWFTVAELQMEPGKPVVKRGMAQQRSLIQLLTGAFFYRASFYSCTKFLPRFFIWEDMVY